MDSTEIGQINNMLNTAPKRSIGLKKLNVLIETLPEEILHKHAIFWISKSLQILENVEGRVQEKNEACEIIAFLVVKAKDVSQLQKQVSLQTVKHVIDIIDNMGTQKICAGMLHLVSVLLKYYPESSGKLQTQIKKILIPLLDSNKKKNVEMASVSFAFLIKATERVFKAPQSKPNYTCWVYNEFILCNSLQAILDTIFVDISETEKDDLEILDLAILSSEDVNDYYEKLGQRFENICIFLSTLLSNGIGKAVVNENDIFQILCHGLSKTPQNFKNEDSVKKHNMSHILTKIHVGLLLVLKNLIIGFRQELLPSSVTILQLIKQNFEWIEETAEKDTTNVCKPYKAVKISTYKTLSAWLKYSVSASGVEMFANHFLPHILKDIVIERDQVVLSVTPGKQPMSAKAMKRFKNSQYENGVLGEEQKISPKHHLNSDLCIEALVALRYIICKGNCGLDASFYKKTQIVVGRTLDDLYARKNKHVDYYSNPICRLELLKVLRSLQMNPHPQVISFTAFAIRTCNLARHDVNNEVAEEAKSMLSAIEKIAHPSAPTLLISDVDDNTNNVNDVAMD